MDPEPQRRYASVNELAADLRRYLAGEPVQARPIGALSRLGKLLLRHRAAALATAAGIALLVGLTAYHTSVLRRERNLARREAENATATATFLTSLFEGSNPIKTGGAQLTARDLLDRGQAKIEEQKDLDPTVHARLLGTMSLARESMGDTALSRELARRSLALHEAAHSPAKDRVWALLQVTHGTWKSGRSREALPFAERAVALAESDADVPVNLRGSATNLLAILAAELGDVKRAAAAYEKLLGVEQEIGSPARTGRALNNFGVLLMNNGDHPGARRRFRESLAAFEKSTEDNAFEIYLPLYNLAELELIDGGDLVLAESQYRRGMAAYQKVHGEKSPEVAYAIASIAEVERQRGKVAAARASIERALAVYAEVLEPGVEDWSWPLQVKGRILLDQGDRAGAVAALESALAIERGLEGDRSRRFGEIGADLAKARAATASQP